MAHWRSAGIGCPSGQFTVLTFDGEDGSFDLVGLGELHLYRAVSAR